MNSQTDIAIVTLPGRFNYGNRLQNYAVQRIFNELGYESTTLQYVTSNVIIRKAKSGVKRILGKSSAGPEEQMTLGRLAAFDQFNSRINIRKVNRFDVHLKNEYKWFVAGSDQVWNPEYMGMRFDWYFLKFARSIQRIALAPSIGLDSLSPFQQLIIKYGTKGFQNLSVREYRGAELLREVTGRKADVICDPTLVVPADEWRCVADDRLTPEKPYVLAYLLGHVESETKAILDEVTHHGKLSIIPLSDRQRGDEPDAGPAEFISLVDHAAHVVTDSFHASVFSSFLHTPLTIARRGSGGSMFSRLETLSKMLGIENKMLGSPEFDLDLAGDYSGVDERISKEREGFLSYLSRCLNA